jgi:MFS family permease
VDETMSEEIRRILREQGRRISELELELAQGRSFEPRSIPMPPPEPEIPPALGIVLLIMVGIAIYILLRFVICFWQAILCVLGFSGISAILGLITGHMVSRRVRGILAAIAGAFSLILLSYVLSQGVVGNFIFEDAYILNSAWNNFYKIAAILITSLAAINVLIVIIKRKILEGD